MEVQGNSLTRINKMNNWLYRASQEVGLDHVDFKITSKRPDFRFYLSYMSIIVLCLISAVVVHNKKGNEVYELIIGLLMLIFSLLVTIISFIFEYRLGAARLEAYLVIVWLYFFTGISIILSDQNVNNVLMQGSEFTGYMSSINSLIVLAVVTKKKAQKLKNYYVMVNIMLAIVWFLLNIDGNQDKITTSFQLFILLIILVYLSSDLKKMKIASVDYSLGHESHVFDSEVKTNDIHQSPKAANTEIEAIVESINASIVFLNHISDTKDTRCKEYAIQALIILKSILEKLRNSANIYLMNFENITKDLDEQDKIYIQQTFMDRDRKSTLFSLPPNKNTLMRQESIYGVSELAGMLSGIGKDWNFNTFLVNDCTGGIPIQTCGTFAFTKFGLKSIFNISDATLSKFLEQLELKYDNNNPYHNSSHGAEVMSSYLYLIFNSFVVDEINSLELLAGIITSLGHDVGHPGKNNRFLMMSMDDLAIQFNDISVLEMHHASILFKVIKEHAGQLILAIDPDRWLLLRKFMIEMILATDMAKHFEMMSHFKTKYLSIYQKPDIDDPEFRLDLFKMTLKCADIGHAAKKKELHIKWCAFIIQEFFEQGDLEKELGLPVSMYCDRENTEISKTQVGFIKNIVMPLYVTFNSIVSSANIKKKCLDQLEKNEKYWSDNRRSRRSTALNKTPAEPPPEYETLVRQITNDRRNTLQQEPSFVNN